ncbi:ABC transporter substrate-binding protein [Arthrobacter sp. SRS-W-1-2016]|jgi:multiple sugar transport system substrate-binding protein|uniref:ABC transporter substrate-binding protein n=1 Tax=Arthrobacter TaxID=1663 RepID=UPI000990BC3E|nr:MULTISPECIES: extracellular solute-binding protein [Arthrobacter]MDQ0209462.1 multiple sugar transport system substrate-binding protein [Arthrobacter bambusae]MDQ0234212.1 multiple sugar transport system substrate-binding protein [Arthrobacter bambusae]OOP62627.1 ABC transporter substrate-binding protein [Arthrobacter sp. SRS-W-1-2016]
MNVQSEAKRNFSRRGFLGLTAAAAAVPLLAACGGGSSSSSAGGAIKFWDMPWATTAYNDAAKKITDGFSGANSKASYQIIQWNNFYQTFSSAIASKTGPAVSTGGGFQAFQFDQQGQIAYADKVVDALKKNGQFDDFLPGVLEPFKSDKGYVAVPWQLDMRPLWYRKSLFDQAGVAVPTDWPSLLEAGKKLKGIGAVGFATGSGAGNNIGNHLMIMMMINNGGGVFTKDGQLDVMNDRNVEATEFLLELVSNGIIDPAAVSYTSDNLDAQWKNKKAAFGMYVLGVPQRVGDTSGDLMVASPMAGPHGDKATLVFPNNIMMYKNTPSQDASEAFLTYYMGQLKTLWQQKLMNALPVFKSITELPEFAGDPNNVKIVKEYQPIAKTFAAQGTSLNANLAVLDGGQALNQFTQTILTGKTDAKSALTAFQSGLQSVLKK